MGMGDMGDMGDIETGARTGTGSGKDKSSWPSWPSWCTVSIKSTYLSLYLLLLCYFSISLAVVLAQPYSRYQQDASAQSQPDRSIERRLDRIDDLQDRARTQHTDDKIKQDARITRGEYRQDANEKKLEEVLSMLRIIGALVGTLAVNSVISIIQLLWRKAAKHQTSVETKR